MVHFTSHLCVGPFPQGITGLTVVPAACGPIIPTYVSPPARLRLGTAVNPQSGNPIMRSETTTLVLQRHVGQLSMAQVIICQELKSFLRISIRTWLMNQNPCETSHFLAIGVLTQR